MQDPGTTETILRLGLAMLLAAVLGWDRERKHKPAGLRTHMLVALGAAAFTIVGVELVTEDSNEDLARVIQGIIGGVGFLGAGAIIQSRGDVHGMTTAAGIWGTAAIGVACGLGEYALATTIGGLAFIVLSVALIVERRISRADEPSDGA